MNNLKKFLFFRQLCCVFKVFTINTLLFLLLLLLLLLHYYYFFFEILKSTEVEIALEPIATVAVYFNDPLF